MRPVTLPCLTSVKRVKRISDDVSCHDWAGYPMFYWLIHVSMAIMADLCNPIVALERTKAVVWASKLFPRGPHHGRVFRCGGEQWQ